MYKDLVSEFKHIYREHGKTTIAARAEAEQAADRISQHGYKNIFFAGSGGSITTIMAFAEIIKRLSDIPAYWEEAAELMVSNYKQLNQDSLVVIMAKTGTMIETVQLSAYCKEHHIPCIGFVMIDDTPVANQVTYKVMLDVESSPIRYLTLYYFVFRLLYNHGDFPDYESFCASLEQLPEALCHVLDAYDETAQGFVERYYEEPFQLWIYSGLNQGEALKYAADIAEELFRQKTQIMNAAEFFHGCLEIADDDTNIILLYNHGDFPDYESFCASLEQLPEALCHVLDAYDETAQGFVERYYEEPFQLWIYSGLNQGEALKYAADIAEELFRQKTQIMNAAEFFHGCLEIADDDTNIILLKSEGPTRVLDERVERFLRKYASKKLVVIDTAQFELPGVDDAYRGYFSPVILNVCIEELITNYMIERTGKSAATRRYYGIVDY